MNNEIELEKHTPKLLQTAKEIVEFRASTSTNEEYLSWKNDEYCKILHYEQQGIPSTNGLNGSLGEAFFFDFCTHFNIPCDISTGDQDLDGIDFFLTDFPIDVTTNPRSGKTKIKPRRFTTLFLPKYIGQKSIVNIDKRSLSEEYLLTYLSSGIPNFENFLSDLIHVNNEILDCLEKQITNPCEDTLFPNSSISNERNLKTILKILGRITT